MKKLLVLTFSSLLGVFVVYAILKLDSLIYKLNNPQHIDAAQTLAEFAIPDLGLMLMFFIVVYPYQFIGIYMLQKLFKQYRIMNFKKQALLMAISTLFYSLIFTMVFGSPALGITDMPQTWMLGNIIFGVYFFVNILTQNFLLKPTTETI